MTGCPSQVGNPAAVRDGSVLFILVLMLTLLIGTFVISLTRLTSGERRNEVHRQQIAVLESAIEAVQRFDSQDQTAIRLPIDEAADHWILVEASEGGSEVQYEATLLRKGTPGPSIVRAIPKTISRTNARNIPPKKARTKAAGDQ